MEYRWLTDDEIENFVNPVCAQRGWAQLNINPEQPTCRVLGAIEGIEIVGFFAFQFFPVLGPEWTDANHRDGKVSRELSEQMAGWLRGMNARGALTVCDSPVSERLAQRHGMQKLESPVYVWNGGG